jgi:uncharacterized protein
VTSRDDIAPTFEHVRTRWLPLWAIGVLVAVVVVARIAGASPQGPGAELATGYALYAGAAVWALRQCRRAGTGVRQLVGPAPREWPAWRLPGITLALVLLSVGAIWLLWLPLSYVAPDLVRAWVLEPDPLASLRDGGVRGALAVALIVFVGPAVEELVFRGVVLRRWAHRWGAGRALFASAAVFGLLHLDVLGAVAFGLVMGMLYVRTGSLWVPVACHMLTNALVVAAELVPWMAGPYTLARFQREWYVGAVALAAALPALWLLRRQYLPGAGWRLPPLGVEVPEALRDRVISAA